MTSRQLNYLFLLLSNLLLAPWASSAFSTTLLTRPVLFGQNKAATGTFIFSTQRRASTQEDNDTSLQSQIDANLAFLNKAAETKQEDPDSVYDALAALEKQMRQAAKADETVAQNMRQQLTGSWRLIFTTGTAKMQEQRGRINYFPLKAVQSFDTTVEPMTIENGIYLGNWPALRFSGTMDFDMVKRKLEFDFDGLELFGLLNLQLGQGEAASLGAKTGLGSESNVANAAKKKAAFFNWISADENIATARGGGGGLALWKRISEDE